MVKNESVLYSMHDQTIELLSVAFYTKKIRRKIGSPSGVVVRFFFQFSAIVPQVVVLLDSIISNSNAVVHKVIKLNFFHTCIRTFTMMCLLANQLCNRELRY